MREQLEKFNQTLRTLYRDLITSQEINFGELLHLSLNDQRFEWIRRLSTLILHIEMRLQEQLGVEILDVRAIYDEAFQLLKAPLEEKFAAQKTAALQGLQTLQPFAKNMHEMHVENEINRFHNPTNI